MLRARPTTLAGVVDRRDVGSWLEGPQGRLGMPATGTGSPACFGRRLAAVIIDWSICQLIAYAFFGVSWGHGGPDSFVPLAVFAVENVLLVGTLGHTVGHRLMGLRVLAMTGGQPGPIQVLLRTSLLCMAIPALIWDRDGRGLHDKIAGTVIVRT